MPPPSLQSVRIRFGEPDPQFDAIVHMRDIERLTLVRAVDNAFAQTEAEREILDRKSNRLFPIKNKWVFRESSG